ncbi:MAG: hypothetical protein Q7T71_11515 [Herbiconiux sp.]|nr:hypothetical protein [Herbiconiux sp.]
MRTDPPRGDDLTTLLVTVKGRVMAKASATRPKRRRRGLAWLLAGGAALLVIGGAGAAVATGIVAEFYTIPHSTNRPADPPPPTDYDQNTNSRLTPEEASLNQLWAAANADVGADAPPASIDQAGGLRDFAAAVTARCYPIRSADEVAELAGLRSAYEALPGESAFQAAQAYFVRATELCM